MSKPPVLFVGDPHNDWEPLYDRCAYGSGPGHIVIRQQVECSPCFLRECPLDFRCMKAVTPEMVSGTVQRVLAGMQAGV